jgi:hypothetical protein
LVRKWCFTCHGRPFSHNNRWGVFFFDHRLPHLVTLFGNIGWWSPFFFSSVLAVRPTKSILSLASTSSLNPRSAPRRNERFKRHYSSESAVAIRLPRRLGQSDTATAERAIAAYDSSCRSLFGSIKEADLSQIHLSLVLVTVTRSYALLDALQYRGEYLRRISMSLWSFKTLHKTKQYVLWQSNTNQKLVNLPVEKKN